MRSREALSTQALLLQSVLDSITEGLVAADARGRFLLWNPAARRILGRGAAPLPPEKWAEHYGFFRGDNGEAWNGDEDPLARAIRGETNTAVMFVKNQALESGVWIEADASPIRNEEGLACGGVVSFRDVSQNRADRQKIQALNDELEKRLADLAIKMEELGRSNAQLEQFAYVASHDLQEPLRMVANYTQLLAERYRGKLDEQADKYIHYAVDGAMRMQAMIEDLLAFSRAGRRENTIHSADCNGLVEQALRNLGAAIRESGAVIEFEALPRVMVNSIQITQLFQNLIGNAIKFHGEDVPRVRISAEKTADDWIFSVADNGIGIAPEHAGTIFAIFQRLHIREEYSGNGIGLAICKKIVERHGGRIWVESAEGEGSTFKFSLPAGAAAEEKAMWAASGA